MTNNKFGLQQWYKWKKNQKQWNILKCSQI
jgi:hypothetical protein